MDYALLGSIDQCVWCGRMVDLNRYGEAKSHPADGEGPLHPWVSCYGSGLVPRPSYIETTRPSDYDTTCGWCGTIGKTELEHLARIVTRYLQQHGNEWVPVFVESVDRFAEEHNLGPPPWKWWMDDRIFFLPNDWLVNMQSVRCGSSRSRRAAASRAAQP